MKAKKKKSQPNHKLFLVRNGLHSKVRTLFCGLWILSLGRCV